jgi:(methylthio)acryloyl-CoA hydratase
MDGSGEASLVTYERRGDVAVIGLNRPEKRNAVSDQVVEALADAVARASSEAKAAVIHGHGPHFCAGLDLAEHVEKPLIDAVQSSRRWHRVFERIERGTIPFVSALHGAVVGGGLRTRRVDAYPRGRAFGVLRAARGQRGIFVGGGGSVRAARLMGAARMGDLMLTGRVVDAAEAERWGIVQLSCRPEGEALTRQWISPRVRPECRDVELRRHQRAAADPGHVVGGRAVPRKHHVRPDLDHARGE